MSVALTVLAKAPRAGRSKTRLCPPCTPAQAAALADAALRDTLVALLATPAARRLLALHGEPGPWLPDGVVVLAQRGDGLDERIAAALLDSGGPALLIGMDTPQVRPTQLCAGLAAVTRDPRGSVLGPAPDGGYWAIGLGRDVVGRARECVHGVPMSAGDTCAAQRARLRELGIPVTELEPLRDVDRFADALEVAAAAPGGHFAAALAGLTSRPALA